MSKEKAIEILKEMFEQRNYTNVEYDGKDNIHARKPNGNPVLCMLDCIYCKLNIDNIKEKHEQLEKQNIKHCIIVYNETITPAVKKDIPRFEKIGFRFELFQLDDLQFNCTKHSLVPKHTLLTPEETKYFKEQYGSNIPVLLHIDPIARFYGFLPGQIIRITRRNGFISYRIVK